MKQALQETIIPTRIIEGLNIKFNSSSNIDIIDVPISTYETTLFASINRGVKLSQQHPISTIVLSNCMTRSVILQCKNIFEIEKVIKLITNEKESDFKTFQKIVNTTSSHCKIKNIEMQNVGNIIYLRFSYNTDEASGHNITTIATNEIAKYIEETLNIEYISNSGNTCCDKKVSAINSISGRGKKVIAEMVISKENCEKILHTTPDKIVQLNIKKNLIGSTIAGSVCSANAHFANMLASLFLPLGQDIANIVEGSQGITYCEVIDNGDLYYGEWDISGNKHGRGIQLWADRSKYIGYWINNKANKKGKLIHKDGDIYDGEWLDDKAEGYGVYSHIDGAKYEGYWKDDRQEGKGKEVWPDGNSYEGDYVAGNKQGIGKFIWSDGSVYEGEFMNNNIEGKGKYIWPDKRIYQGTWKNNQMDGTGKFTWPDGRIYEGGYKNDKKDGYGVFKWPNGREYRGYWKIGKQEGEGEFFYPDTKESKKYIWEKGKMIV